MSAPTLDANFALNVALLLMLVAIAFAVVRTRSLLAAILMMSVYSLASAAWLMVADAADVAFTEAVVGAGVSTVILLGAILLARGETERVNWKLMIAPGALAVIVGAVLIYAAGGLPDYGDPASPANSHVGRAYLEQTYSDIGAPNVVTAVLASYRGLMLGFGPRATLASPTGIPNDQHVVLRVVAKLLIPLIALFALYVQFHGDLGAGGGFQAGVITAVAIILHALVFGLRATMAAVPVRLARTVAAMGVVVYAGVGVVCIVNGGGFLDYDYLFSPRIEAMIPANLLGDPSHEHHWGQHFGILFIEIGVLLTVSATIVTMFYGFAGRTIETIEAERFG
jgi:multicomponent Na+:H+ antiporter subunit B